MLAIIKNYRGRNTLIIAETMEQLVEGFSYTLSVGNSWKPSVNTNPKTPKSLVLNLDKCDMVHGFYDNYYYTLNNKQTKKAVELLDEEELKEAKTDSSGCWKQLTEEELKLITESN